ncbi:DMT family transporter [Streptococcus ictaluri]|nr:DMT family transporter [Streptococcus ictaluri]
MVLLAGIAWGISGVSGQYLLHHGVSVNLLTSLRLLISGAFLTLLAYGRQPQQFAGLLKDKTFLKAVLAYSILGLSFNQYAYLLAIQYSNAGTTTVLQYLSPVLVLVYTTTKAKVAPSFMELIAIALAISGTVIMSCHGDLSHLAISPKGLFWGLLSAVTYSYCIIKPAKLIEEIGSLPVIGIAMLMGGFLFALVTHSWTYSLELTASNGLALFGIIGIGTLFAYTVFLKGASLIGPVKASLLASVEPVASVIFAILLMKEVFYPIDLMGMALILLAVLLISFRDLLLYQREKQVARLLKRSRKIRYFRGKKRKSML